MSWVYRFFTTPLAERYLTPSTTSASRTIPANIDTVWQVMSDLEDALTLYPFHGTPELELTGRRPPLGNRYALPHRIPLLGSFERLVVVREWDPPVRAVFFEYDPEIPEGRFPHYVGYDLVPLSDDRTRLTVAVTGPIPAFFGWMTITPGLNAELREWEKRVAERRVK